MSRNFSFYSLIISTILFITFVFMNFIGYWAADPTIQILFFFIMIVSVFNAGMAIGKKQFSKS